jgi:hypothetical protein
MLGALFFATAAGAPLVVILLSALSEEGSRSWGEQREESELTPWLWE